MSFVLQIMENNLKMQQALAEGNLDDLAALDSGSRSSTSTNSNLAAALAASEARRSCLVPTVDS